MKILLVEPYYGGSHRVWADAYRDGSVHDVTLVTHEARFWKWRMHGAHLTLTGEASAALAAVPDALLVSSMLNVPAFLGAARRTVGDAPVAVYFHESQFTYPLSPLDRPDDTYPMINWASAAVADLPIFNSAYHRELFFEQARRFLRRFPDHRHGRLVDAVEGRSVVLPVGVDLRRIGAPGGDRDGGPPTLLWNQRWEHDKGPDEFVVLVETLLSRGLDFRVAVVGERFVSAPESFDRLPGLLGDRLVGFGYLPDDEYVAVLRDADVVVSTAHHEFFGVAVVEAIAAGAFPVLPDRLVYPERIPEAFHGDCLYREADGLVDRVTWAIEHREKAAGIAAELAGVVQRFDREAVAPRYDETMERLVADVGETGRGRGRAGTEG